MAANIFTGATNNNWITATNWSLGTVPTATDGHIATFDATSPNCTLTTTARVCNNIDFTGYTNTITFSSTLTVSGNVTLDTNMIFASSSALIVNANSTFTSNGKTVDVPLKIGLASSTITITLADDLTPSVSYDGNGNTSTVTMNGNNLILTGGVALNGVNGTICNGTTLYKVTGACTWSVSAAGHRIRNNFTVEATGVLTIINTVYYQSGTFSVVTGGNILSDGSTFNIVGLTAAPSVTLDLNGISLSNILFTGTTTFTTTLLSDLIIRNNCSIGTVNGTGWVFNGYSIYVGGNLSQNGTASTISGTTNFITNGNNTFSQPNATSATACTFKNNLEVNTDGYLIILGQFNYSTGEFKITKGRVLLQDYGVSTFPKTALVVVASATFTNCHRVNFKTITLTAGITLTMNEFFNGSPAYKTRIKSTTTSNYIITFTDTKKKISKYINITNATITERNQLRVITANNAIRTGNIGVVFEPNIWGNGTPLNSGIVRNQGDGMTFSAGSLQNDPNFIIGN